MVVKDQSLRSTYGVPWALFFSGEQERTLLDKRRRQRRMRELWHHENSTAFTDLAIALSYPFGSLVDDLRGSSSYVEIWAVRILNALAIVNGGGVGVLALWCHTEIRANRNQGPTGIWHLSHYFTSTDIWLWCGNYCQSESADSLHPHNLDDNL